MTCCENLSQRKQMLFTQGAQHEPQDLALAPPSPVSVKTLLQFIQVSAQMSPHIKEVFVTCVRNSGTTLLSPLAHSNEHCRTHCA